MTAHIWFALKHTETESRVACSWLADQLEVTLFSSIAIGLPDMFVSFRLWNSWGRASFSSSSHKKSYFYKCNKWKRSQSKIKYVPEFSEWRKYPLHSRKWLMVLGELLSIQLGHRDQHIQIHHQLQHLFPLAEPRPLKLKPEVGISGCFMKN